jgi:hypothetical protein
MKFNKLGRSDPEKKRTEKKKEKGSDPEKRKRKRKGI